MRGDCVYLQVMVQMYIKGWDSRTLAEESGITYTSLRRKLRGMAPLSLEEARRIQEALDCGMSLDKLFARREDAA
ncbi:MAG: helix-turn-helix transcriptional regulator [Clostridia bacterium]|nr:helix-turn-helix transcriptional regulator [Clostridia bacterium]